MECMARRDVVRRQTLMADRVRVGYGVRKKKAASPKHGVGLTVTQGTETGQRGVVAGWA